MKKTCIAFILIALLSCSTLVFAEDTIRVMVDGKYIITSEAAVIKNGRTLVPLRPIFEALGINPEWDDTTKTVKARSSVVELSLTIGSPMATVNGIPIMLDSPGILVNGSTMVPVRFVGETFGATAEWLPDSKVVIIKTDAYQHPDQKAEGKSVTALDGSVYTGSLRNGFYDGEGTLKKTDGTLYVGTFKAGKYEGKGLLTLPNGDKYEGEFKAGNVEGKGKFTYINGDVYEGRFENYIKTGDGTFRFCNGDVYIGQWKDNSMNGEGTMTYKNGDKYVGSWVNGKRDGEGKMNGRPGTWKDDRLKEPRIYPIMYSW